MTATFDQPGFLRCVAAIEVGKKNYYKILSAGFDVLKISMAVPEPEGFRKFWDKALAESVKLPVDAKMEKLENYSTDKSTSYKISVAAPNGRIYGFLRIPNGDGPSPLIVSVPGAGAGVDRPVILRDVQIDIILYFHSASPYNRNYTISFGY